MGAASRTGREHLQGSSPPDVHLKPDSGRPRRPGPAPIRTSESLRAQVTMVVAPRPERWQSAFVCPELDSAVVPSVRGQPGTLSLFVPTGDISEIRRSWETTPATPPTSSPSRGSGTG